MRTRLVWSLAIAAAVAITLWAQQPAAAPAPEGSKPGGKAGGKGKRGPVPPKGPLPRMADGKPDLNGLWRGSTGDMRENLMPGEQIVLTPAAEKLMQSRMSKDDPEALCLPAGVPRLPPYPWRIVQIPNYVFVLFEANIHSYRQIFTDGRKHKPELNSWPTWYGDSVGTWEGDTLVVDTTGYNDRFWFDAKGHPHTDQLHTIERFMRKDLGTLVLETQIIDPGSYVKPFKISITAVLSPNEDLLEYICAENNQDVSHIQNDKSDR